MESQHPAGASGVHTVRDRLYRQQRDTPDGEIGYQPSPAECARRESKRSAAPAHPAVSEYFALPGRRNVQLQCAYRTPGAPLRRRVPVAYQLYFREIDRYLVAV